MQKANVDAIKRLRDETGAGVLEVKETLEAHNGNETAALADLMKNASAKAAKKQDRIASDGLIYSYIHTGGKVGTLVHLSCETDFVAKTDDFKNLCREIAMQVCVGDYKDAAEVLSAEYIRDSDKKVGDLIIAATAKMGEKIELKRFVKFAVGELR